MTRVYFGNYAFKPVGINELPEKLRRTCLSEFAQALKEEMPSFWTNNPFWLDFFSIDSLYLCLEPGISIKLTEHPDWRPLRNRFTPTEFAISLAFRLRNTK